MVEYLGYILSPMGLSMDPVKVQTIQDWPEPRKVKDVQSFLDFANFYRQFIHEYSKIVVPLTRLTQKDLKWNFSDACRDAFNKLKTAFLSAPVLTHWILDTPMMVETDVLIHLQCLRGLRPTQTPQYDLKVRVGE